MSLALFPESARVLDGGILSVGGVSMADLADRFGTPCYVVDTGEFRLRAARYVDGLTRRWPDSDVLFASKAFPAVALYALAGACGLAIDVSGQGEIVMAMAAGVDPGRLYFHGNAKTPDELRYALDVGVGTIVIDNLDELDQLTALAQREQHVLIRVIPGIAPDTHPSQSTGGADSKFGLTFEQAKAAIAQIGRDRHLILDGVHAHIGSQVLDAAPFARAVRQIAALGRFPVYDIGGGLGERYTYAERPPSIEEYLDAVTEAAQETLPAGARLLIEPGRSLIARAGLTLYSVVSVKRTGRTFVAVDGGMADNMDPPLTGQRYEAAIATRMTSEGTVTCDVVGRHCESGDSIIRGVDLPDPSPGDLLAVPVTGAYSYTMANNYNGARKPPVVFVENGRARQVVSRETYDDLLRLQVTGADALVSPA